MIINNPGSGESSELPAAAMKKIRKTGSFDPYGEIVGGAINKFLPDYDNLTMYGHSMGARAVIATAPYVIAPIDYLALTDPPGSRQFKLVDFLKAFAVKEGAHAAEYAKRSDNFVSLRLQKENDSLANTIDSIGSMGIIGAKQMFFDWPIAIHKDGLAYDLENLAKSKNVGTVQINSPEKSELNNPEDVRIILSELAKSYPHLVLRQLLLLGQTHSVNVGGSSHTTGTLSKLV